MSASTSNLFTLECNAILLSMDFQFHSVCFLNKLKISQVVCFVVFPLTRRIGPLGYVVSWTLQLIRNKWSVKIVVSLFSVNNCKWNKVIRSLFHGVTTEMVDSFRISNSINKLFVQSFLKLKMIVKKRFVDFAGNPIRIFKAKRNCASCNSIWVTDYENRL